MARKKIIVDAHKWYVVFYLGVRAYKAGVVFEQVGNYQIGMDFVDMLERLGHTVEVIDSTDEDY